jgi:serine-type D-Ala-D-Ala carboxypeptidase/endopeptidase (penicillin-binding protein 4)
MRYSIRLIVLIVLAATWSAALRPVSAQPAALVATIDAVLADTAFADAFWGIHIVDLATGRTVYSRNAVNNFIPASTMKLLTTAAALEALGPDFRYTTGLYLHGERRGDRLDGHLVVRGSGDPTISDRQFAPLYPIDGDPHAVFRQWADSLQARGVRRITGHVIGDDGVFDDLLLGNGWAWDDEPTAFAAQISGLSFNEGRLRITTVGAAPGRQSTVLVEPATDYVNIVNRTRSLSSQSTARSVIRRDQGGNTIWLDSEVPQGQSVSRLVSVHNPTRYFVHALRGVLRDSGVAVDGDPVDGSDWREVFNYGQMVRVATHSSPPLSEIAAVTNKVSQNLYAEHLLRTLGAERCGEARLRAAARGRSAARLICGSAEAGLLVAEDLFERAGMRAERMRLRDGSGMSPYNMVSPIDLTALLTYMWSHPDPAVRDAFVNSLAVGGEDGTLRGRFTQGPAHRNVWGKTGTVTGARNLAGYVTTASGTPVAFALLANQFGTTTNRVTTAQDRIVDALARHRGSTAR